MTAPNFNVRESARILADFQHLVHGLKQRSTPDIVITMKRTTKNPSRRIQVEQQLAEQLARLAIPQLSGELPLLSIIRVTLTPDLKSGIVWVTAAESVAPAAVVARVTAQLPRWRALLRPQLSLRYFPNLIVRYDEGQSESIRIESILEQS